jgi:hypothetical protein
MGALFALDAASRAADQLTLQAEPAAITRPALRTPMTLGNKELAANLVHNVHNFMGVLRRTGST